MKRGSEILIARLELFDMSLNDILNKLDNELRPEDGGFSLGTVDGGSDSAQCPADRASTYGTRDLGVVPFSNSGIPSAGRLL